jgi:PEP-CTERM motif
MSKNKMVLCNSHRSAVLGFVALAFLALAISAQATNLVTNGSFEMTTNGPGQMGFNTDAVGWTTTGYNFIFGPGTADNGGVTGQFGNVQLWGPGNGSNNGLPATSPDGGNFIAADGAFQVAPIEQTINGLTVGNQYTVSFYWGGAQQFGFDGATTEQFQVSLGNQSFLTAVLQNPTHGFTGWMFQQFTFTADNTSDVLAFLAIGTPTGVPPFVLLDGVSMNAAGGTTPEPGTLLLMIGGLGSLGAVRWKTWNRR